MIRLKSLAGLLVLILMPGCASQTHHRLPRFAHPPQMITSSSWTERLPRGAFRTQQPTCISILVTENSLPGPQETKEFLKAEMKKAIQAKGTGDLPFHYYLDGSGNLYRGRRDQFEGIPPMKLDTEGVIWVAMLDYNLDLDENKGARDVLVHLLTYLAFTYEMGDNHVKVMALTDEGRNSPLYEQLKTPDFTLACVKALEETRAIARQIPAAPMWERSQRMRIHESDE